MLSDDVFRRAFEVTSTRFINWAEQLLDVASVDHEATADYLRLSLKPHAAAACALDFLLQRPSQTYDVQFYDGDVWEERPAGDDPGHLLAMLDAVVEGRIVLRRQTLVATGTPVARSIIVSPRGADPIRFGDSPMSGTVVADRHWAPYRR